MSSESGDDAIDSTKASASEPDSSKRIRGKVPKKVHKAAREKMKRDQMNELFLELGTTIDLDHPNNGKASILRETIRLVGELLAQVENLKKENATLSSESSYVTIERNELLEETNALDAKIKRLQSEIDERAKASSINTSQPQCYNPTQLPEGHVAYPLVGHSSEATPLLGPVFVMPLQHEADGFVSPFPEIDMTKGIPNVSRPQPRYPSSSWPSHILAKQTTNVTEDA